MKLIKAAAAALNQTPLDWDGNKKRILSAISAARNEKVSILCLPELCISGYGCEDAFHSPGLQNTAQQVLLEIAPQTHGIIVSLGLPILHDGTLFNTAALLVNGKILGIVGKQNLAGAGIHYEPRWYEPWPAGQKDTTEIEGKTYPLGDLLFDCEGVRIGFEICEDAWVANRPGSKLAGYGVDILLNPSASHFAFGKQQVREKFILEGSRDFGVSYLYANLLGNEAGRIIYDGGTMIASSGRFLSQGSRFSYADYKLISAVIDIDATRKQRARIDNFQSQDQNNETKIINCAYNFPQISPSSSAIELPNWEAGKNLKEEEFTRAAALGLLDYLRKSRSHGFVVSLSGGADSTAVATLAAFMVRLGVAELGLRDFLKKINYLNNLDTATTEQEIVNLLITCVYQATRNSSEQTRHAARTVADTYGAELLEFDVDPIVQQYISMISDAIGRELNWECDDLTLQNIQARVRSPGVWMLANLRGALLLSTSNRSEAAVGYATMDGDTSGGLCPIAGVDKAFLKRWLTWMEKQGPEGFGPVESLSAVNRLIPTAELRPQSAAQTDEEDLMPYEVLDAIERAAILDKQTPLEVFQTTLPNFKQFSARQFGLWVERFFQLWCRNQWKRERYAPSFHMDDESLDPKTWCRFPILSGGYQRELAELRAYLDSNYSN